MLLWNYGIFTMKIKSKQAEPCTEVNPLKKGIIIWLCIYVSLIPMENADTAASAL